MVCFILFIIINHEPRKTAKKTIDPTGTYVLVEKTKDSIKQTNGYEGKVQVELLENDQVFILLTVNAGPPAYNSGMALDTLTYKNNYSTYVYFLGEEPSCKISFHFTEKGVQVKQVKLNPFSTCGFGHGVTADGYYKKTSSEIPEFINPMTGQKIDN